ncbi:Exostosin domain-containing protein [Cephalotus follicularis]|uniref:Exostosin domain-containing protein n=1 Tax=Cephalotus follicularis TaxID=3775 RepID=A0A1Q3CNH8_CEPFO|nr:Exostosin domain-containing protein [Cephalotus follicularis]
MAKHRRIKEQKQRDIQRQPDQRPPLIFCCHHRNAGLCTLLIILIACLLGFCFILYLSLWVPPLVFKPRYQDSVASTHAYHSPEDFKLDYEQMEREFKVFMYPDLDESYYQTPLSLTGKYASEGYFVKNLMESQFLTHDPDEAHLFFFPIFCTQTKAANVRTSENLTSNVEKFFQKLIHKYPYWNRTLGADHFFVTCYDTGVEATERVPLLVKNSIRVVCSPSYAVGYNPHKDVSLPPVKLPVFLPADRNNDTKSRTTFALWRGRINSELRAKLEIMWENDSEFEIISNNDSEFEIISNPIKYTSEGFRSNRTKFSTTKFCICAHGANDNTPCILDSILYGCVPVIISDYNDLPFSDILDWSTISFTLKESDVHLLKAVLLSVSDAVYETMHKSILEIQKHFHWHSFTIKYDSFHMVMYELWLRRHVIKYPRQRVSISLHAERNEAHADIFID